MRQFNVFSYAMVFSIFVSFGCGDSLETESRQRTDSAKDDRSLQSKATRTGTSELLACSKTRYAEEQTPRGKFQTVLNVNNSCTGSIIGNYTVLTADHCKLAEAKDPFVGWEGDDSPAFSGIDIDNVTDHPLTNGSKYSVESTTNHAHDLTVAEIPKFSPDYLNHVIRFATADPTFGADSVLPVVGGNGPITPNVQRTVGLQDDDGDTEREREWAHSKYKETPPHDNYHMNEVTNEDLDSGGPTFVANKKNLHWNNENFKFRQSVAGVHKTGTDENSCNVTSTDIPVYRKVIDTTGSMMSLSSDQKVAKKINRQWIRAAGSDVDGDAIPYLCDSKPTVNSGASSNLCMNADLDDAEAQYGDNETDIPRGQLKCMPGFYATGYKGKDGWFIDKISIECTPSPCLRNDTSDANCPEIYWTSSFAGQDGGGGSFHSECDKGTVLTDVRVKDTDENDGDGMLYELQGRCSDYKSAVDYGYRTSRNKLRILGNDQGNRTKGSNDGNGFDWCNEGDSSENMRPIRGFEFRSDLQDDDTLSYVTGGTAICAQAHLEETRFVGAETAWVNGNQTCPRDMMGVGAVAAPDKADNSDLGVLGILCLEKDAVADNVDPKTTSKRRMFAHSSYQTHGKIYPFGVEDFSQWKNGNGLGSTDVVQFCGPGERVVGVTLEKGGDSELTGLDTITCRESGTDYVYGVDAGTDGTAEKITCADSNKSGAVGFIFSDDSGVNGASMLCRRKN